MGPLAAAITPYRPHFPQGRALIPGAEQGVANPDGLGLVRVIGAHKPGFVMAALGRGLQAVVGNHRVLLAVADQREELTP